MVISSPLRRCLQSASLAFPAATRGLRPFIVCNELVREAYGMHYPDKRGKKSDAQVSLLLLMSVRRILLHFYQGKPLNNLKLINAFYHG